MITKELIQEYRKARKDTGGIVGQNALWSLRAARCNLQWAILDDCGLVRLQWVPDESPDLSWAGEKDLEIAERDGVWGLVGEYCIEPQTRKWKQGDSVWGFIGQNDGGYGHGIKQGTIDALREGLNARCPRCRKGN